MVSVGKSKTFFKIQELSKIFLLVIDPNESMSPERDKIRKQRQKDIRKVKIKYPNATFNSLNMIIIYPCILFPLHIPVNL